MIQAWYGTDCSPTKEEITRRLDWWYLPSAGGGGRSSAMAAEV